MLSLSKRLRRTLIDAAGRSVTEAAKLYGMSRPALSNVVNGNAALSIELALKIEQIDGPSARDLLIEQLDEQLAAARSRPS